MSARELWLLRVSDEKAKVFKTYAFLFRAYFLAPSMIAATIF